MKLESIKAIDDLEVFLISRGLHKEAQELRKLAALPLLLPLTFKASAAITSLLGGAGIVFDYYGNHTNLYKRCGADPDGTAEDAMSKFVAYALKQDVVNGIGSFPADAPGPIKAKLAQTLWNAFRELTPGDITESWIQDSWAAARGESIWNFDDEDYYENTLTAILEHRDAEYELKAKVRDGIEALESALGRASTQSEKVRLIKYMAKGWSKEKAVFIMTEH